MKRRDFLKTAGPLATLPLLINGQSIKAFGQGNRSNRADFVDTDHVLVIIQLNGGNDGLNTVIPLDQYSNLSKARSNVLIDEKKVLKLNGYSEVGFHPSMGGMKNMFNDGKLAVVRGVGYPNPNYSHFRSTDIWMTGSDSDETITTGWMGRYLAEEWPNYPSGFPNDDMPDPLAIQIGSVVSPVCQGPSASMGMAISDPDAFYQLITGNYDQAPNTKAGKELEYIRTVADQTNDYAKRVKEAAGKAENKSTKYPAERQNPLADQLKIVAQLVAGGLKTRVYIVTIGGFDTHAQQVDQTAGTDQGMHANLLGNLSEAIDAFQDDLELLSLQHRVTGMTFSEFGRRIKSNASMGTDHGAAAPMFLFGAKVKSGIIGNNPNIPDNVTVNDNLPMQYDFRSVYASLLDDWFCLEDPTVNSVMLDTFQRLPLLQESCSVSSADRDRMRKSGDALIQAYPNPFIDSTTIRFSSTGERVLIQLMNAEGRVLENVVDQVYSQGEYRFVFNAGHLPAGNYYYRYQSGTIQQVKRMVKIQ